MGHIADSCCQRDSDQYTHKQCDLIDPSHGECRQGGFVGARSLPALPHQRVSWRLPLTTDPQLYEDRESAGKQPKLAMPFQHLRRHPVASTTDPQAHQQEIIPTSCFSGRKSLVRVFRLPAGTKLKTGACWLSFGGSFHEMNWSDLNRPSLMHH